MLCNALTVTWLNPSNANYVVGIQTLKSSVAQSLIQIDFPTRFLNNSHQNVSLLDLLFTSSTGFYSSSHLYPLGNSDYTVVSIDIYFDSF